MDFRENYICLFVLNCGSIFTRILVRKKNVLAAYRLCAHVIIYFQALISPTIITPQLFPIFTIFLFSLRIFIVYIISPRSRKKGLHSTNFIFPILSNFKHRYKYSKRKLLGKLDFCFYLILQT